MTSAELGGGLPTTLQGYLAANKTIRPPPIPPIGMEPLGIFAHSSFGYSSINLSNILPD